MAVEDGKKPFDLPSSLRQGICAPSRLAMSDHALVDVFSADEVARAAGVPVDVIDLLTRQGLLRNIPGTKLFSATEIVRAVPDLRAAAVSAQPAYVPDALFGRAGRELRSPSTRRSLIVSLCAHGALLILMLVLASGRGETAAAAPAEELPRLVFLITPGPGGGGGGSGARQRTPAPRLEREGNKRVAVSTPRVSPDPVLTSTRREEPPPPAPTPAPTEKPVEPLASQAVVAPLVMAAVNPADRAGVIAPPAEKPDSLGPGTGGDAGAGRGQGSGEGVGSGIGQGSGGGTGGGPYRPGSGIQPPRLLREVKAEYTEEARKRGLTGDVVLEIVIKRDGHVGDVTVKRGLGAGLEQRAITAVRQWQFSPAMRQGEAIDVIVEVSVEFTMR